MAWVERLVTRTTQPQDACAIDWTNPITQGLVDVFDFTGVPRSVVLRTPVTFFATRPSLGVATQAGRAIDTTANGFGCYFQRSDGAYATAEQTHIAVSNFSGGGTTFGGYFLTSDSTAANQVLGLGYVSSDNSYFTDGTNTSFSTPGISNNNFKVKSLSVGNGSVKFYNDGVLGGTLSRTATARATSRIRFFGDHASYWVKGRSALHLIFNRALSDAEIKSLSDNPWQIFEPEIVRIWVDDYVSAGGGATVIPIGVQATGSVGTPSATGAANATPSGVSTTASVGTPTATGGSSIAATALPAGVAASSAVGAPTATGAAVAQPAGLSAVSAVGVPVAIAGANIPATALPAGVQASGAVGTAVATGAAVAQPIGVASTAYVGTPTIATGVSGVAVAYPAGVQAIGQVGALIATGAAWTAAVGVHAVGSVGTPTAYAGELVIYTPGAQTRPSRLQSSSRPSRLQTGTRASR